MIHEELVIDISGARHLGNYRLEISFSDGMTRIVDFGPFLNRSVSVHSPSQRERVGGRENLGMAGIGDLSPLPTSPRWG